MADYGTVARPYARAVFDIALAANDLDGWSEALAAAARVASDKVAREYLGRPERSAKDRSEFIGPLAAELPGARLLASHDGQNLLRLLAENDRLDALSEVSKQFDELKAARENRVKVRLIAASAVDTAQTEKIAGALSKRLGREVELELEIDESLLGGAIVRAEDMVIDDSLRARLARLTSSLID
jgi:F-type H+-transporting ATPase subunit delta